MSMKTYLEAFESVLVDELAGRSELIVFRPGARHALEESERDVALPRVGRMSLSIALGAAMTGMHPVLDLRSEAGCTEWLMDGLCDLPTGTASAVTIVTEAEDADVLADIPGILMMKPQSTRQAAGFARAALRNDRLTVLLLDRALYEEEDDVPEEDDFIMLPLDEEIQIPDSGEAAEPEEINQKEPDQDNGTECLPEESAEPEAEIQAENEACGEAADGDLPESRPDELTAEQADAVDEEEIEAEVQSGPEICAGKADDEAEDVNRPELQQAELPVRRAYFCATRMTTCDMNRLNILAADLDMPKAELVSRCMSHVEARLSAFDWQYESDAQRGECAFLPPVGEKASLWLGRDTLTASYDAEMVSHDAAAALLRAVRRVLEKPTLLIYDKEYEEEMAR